MPREAFGGCGCLVASLVSGKNQRKVSKKQTSLV